MAPAKEAKIGDNSAMTADERKKLKGYFEQIVGLERERAETQEDIKSLYESVKEAGFSTKALRRAVKQKLLSQSQKIEEDALQELTDIYVHALGLVGTPLGQAAVDAAAAKLGTPTDLTEEEVAKGYTHAWVDRDGNRVATDIGKIGVQMDLSERPDVPAAT